MIRDIAETLTREVVGPLNLMNLASIGFALMGLAFALRLAYLIRIREPRLREQLLEASVIQALEQNEEAAPDFVVEAFLMKQGLSVHEWALRVGTMAAKADIDPAVRGDIVTAIFRPSLETRSLA